MKMRRIDYRTSLDRKSKDILIIAAIVVIVNVVIIDINIVGPPVNSFNVQWAEIDAFIS